MRIAANLSRRPDGKQGAARWHGFTLLEMLMVLAVVGIVLAFALSGVSSWQRRQAVGSAASMLLAHLKQARTLAVSENRQVSITFSSQGYVFDADTTGSCTRCRNQSIDLTQFDASISVSPTTTRTFSSRGTVNFGTITLDVHGVQRTITLNAIGRAYL